MADRSPRDRIRDAWLDPAALGIALAWLALYVWRAVWRHHSLDTNALDLSVFDYALWSLVHGGRGVVPFMGFSIFSHHFMPILTILAPVYALFQSPVFLIVLQLVVTAAAGVLFFTFARRLGLARGLALALLAVFLFSRRTHGAAAGMFYPECLQALLTLAVVMTWTRGGWPYWTSALLLLMTKEDAAIYLASFALVVQATPLRKPRQSVISAAAAVVWLVVAVQVMIPASRAADGLPRHNPVMAARFAEPDGHVDPGALTSRLFSTRAASRIFDLIATTAALPLFGSLWIVPAVPGIAANLAADPETMQAALTNHYFWPVLPWLMMAAAAGASNLSRRWPRAAGVWVLALLAGTLADNPALRRVFSTRLRPEGAIVREQLRQVRGRQVLAQNNLIPQLPHQPGIFTFGGADARPPVAPDLVLLTPFGDMWPQTPEEVRTLIRRYEADPAYREVSAGPLYAFKLKE